METDGLQGEVVNLGNPIEITVRQFAEAVIDVTNSNSEVIFLPLPVDDPTRRQPDISKASRLLGWQRAARERTGLHITVTDLLVRTVAQALRAHPSLTLSWSDSGLVAPPAIGVGLAVALEDGLVVPVIQAADTLDLSGVCARREQLVARAREGRLEPQDVHGGTFTISNLGMFDVEEFVAIINPPQAAILAIGSITETPVVKNGEIAVGHRMKIALSCDHRISDGAEVARFLISVKKYLQSPMLLAIS